MNPFFFPILLLSLILILYLTESVAERPNLFRAVVFVLAMMESCIAMAFTV